MKAKAVETKSKIRNKSIYISRPTHGTTGGVGFYRKNVIYCNNLVIWYNNNRDFNDNALV